MHASDSCLELHVYRISGNFRYLKIFVMEKFDNGNFNFRKVNLCEFFDVRKFACTKISCGKMQELNESTVPPRLHVGALLVFLSQRFGTGIETRRTFHRGLAACIKTTRLDLSREDC